MHKKKVNHVQRSVFFYLNIKMNTFFIFNILKNEFPDNNIQIMHD